MRENNNAVRAFITTEPGAHMANPVKQSAKSAPIVPTATAYGKGNIQAARYIKPSPTWT